MGFTVSENISFKYFPCNSDFFYIKTWRTKNHGKKPCWLVSNSFSMRSFPCLFQGPHISVPY